MLFGVNRKSKPVFLNIGNFRRISSAVNLFHYSVIFASSQQPTTLWAAKYREKKYRTCIKFLQHHRPLYILSHFFTPHCMESFFLTSYRLSSFASSLNSSLVDDFFIRFIFHVKNFCLNSCTKIKFHVWIDKQCEKMIFIFFDIKLLLYDLNLKLIAGS